MADDIEALDGRIHFGRTAGGGEVMYVSAADGSAGVTLTDDTRRHLAARLGPTRQEAIDTAVAVLAENHWWLRGLAAEDPTTIRRDAAELLVDTLLPDCRPGG